MVDGSLGIIHARYKVTRGSLSIKQTHPAATKPKAQFIRTSEHVASSLANLPANALQLLKALLSNLLSRAKRLGGLLLSILRDVRS